MKLAYKKNQIKPSEHKELSAELLECRQKQAFQMASVGALLQFIKEFALDLKELGSDAFKNDIDALEAKFNPDEKLKKTKSRFKKA